MAKADKTDFADNNARQTFAEQKLWAYEDYAQSRSRLPEEVFNKIRPLEQDRQGQRGRNDKADRPKPISVPFAAKPKPKPNARSTSRESKGSKEGKGGKTAHRATKETEEIRERRNGRNSGPTTQEHKGKNEHRRQMSSSSGRNYWGAARRNSWGDHTDNWQDKQWQEAQRYAYYNAKKQGKNNKS